MPVFRRHPALAAAAQPARHLLGEARRAQDMRVAEAHQARAFRMLGEATLQRYAAQFVRRPLDGRIQKPSRMMERLVTPREQCGKAETCHPRRAFRYLRGSEQQEQRKRHAR
jgi:hypothetical protein